MLKEHLSLFGGDAKWHLLRVAAASSMALALALRLVGSDGRWAELLPNAIVATLLAVWLKPAIFSGLDGFVTRQAPLSAGWLAALAGSVAVAAAATRLASLLIGQLTYAEDLPHSVWLLDGLISLVLVSAVYTFAPASQLARKPSRRQWAAFAIFLLAGLGLVWKALHFPMTWDDLHLIRSFSPGDLAGSFYGNWEPDRLETPGYRPLSMLFNHSRYLLFQEDVVLHRVFLLGLYAAFLTQVASIAQRFGLALPFGVIGGLLAFTARHSIYHYVWLADGIHLFQGLLVTQTLLFMLRGIHTRQMAYFIYGLLAGLSALLVREDNLILVPLAGLFALAYLRHIKAPPFARKASYVFLGLLALQAVLYYLARSHWVQADSIGFDLAGMLAAARMSVFGFIGEQGFDAVSQFFVAAWPILLAALAAALLSLLRSSRGQGAVLWLAAAATACLVGLTNDRVNLLLFCMTFFAMAVAALLAEYATKGRGWQLASGLLAAAMLFGSAHVSLTAMEAFHPYAANVVYWNTEFVYGQFASATIPPERYKETQKRLASLGIRQADIPRHYHSALFQLENSDAFSKLVRQALIRGDRRPVADQRLFVPLLEPFTP